MDLQYRVGIDEVVGANLHATLADVDQLGVFRLLPLTSEGDWDLESGAMVAEASIDDHVTGGRESADGIFYRDWLFEGEQSAGLVEVAYGIAPSHDDQRNGVGLSL